MLCWIQSREPLLRGVEKLKVWQSRDILVTELPKQAVTELAVHPGRGQARGMEARKSKRSLLLAEC